MLKLPALRLILPLMSPSVKLLALPLLLPRLITPPLCVIAPALLNARGRTSSVPLVAPIPAPALTLMRLVCRVRYWPAPVAVMVPLLISPPLALYS